MPQLHAVEDDILLNGSYRKRFHVLRAANILNIAYFDVPTLERMVSNLRARLLPGGLFIVCRTDEAGVNNASVFTLGDDGRFVATARLNEGSEIAELVLRLPPEC
jgi:chemotaxis methyl-accepting protein methylase